MERRVLLKLAAAGFFAPRAHAALAGRLISIAPAAAAATKPGFFSRGEMVTLDRLTEIIIPADGHSPGASAAKVNVYIDVMVSEGGNELRRQWKQGLKAVSKASEQEFGTKFNDLDPTQQEAIVARMAENEQQPSNELQQFFTRLKRMTIDGYYTSKIGIHEDLRYQGNTAIAEFPGCTHPEHQA